MSFLSWFGLVSWFRGNYSLVKKCRKAMGGGSVFECSVPAKPTEDKRVSVSLVH